MNGWQAALIYGAVIFCVVGIYNLLQLIEKLQRQVEHLHTVLYGELRKMQGKDY